MQIDEKSDANHAHHGVPTNVIVITIKSCGGVLTHLLGEDIDELQPSDPMHASLDRKQSYGD
jgi:hypothetical protein